MKIVEFNVNCPFEIGEMVVLEGDSKPSKITDIVTSHYVRSGMTVFLYELDNGGYHTHTKITGLAEKQEKVVEV